MLTAYTHQFKSMAFAADTLAEELVSWVHRKFKRRDPLRMWDHIPNIAQVVANLPVDTESERDLKRKFNNSDELDLTKVILRLIKRSADGTMQVRYCYQEMPSFRFQKLLDIAADRAAKEIDNYRKTDQEEAIKNESNILMGYLWTCLNDLGDLPENPSSDVQWDLIGRAYICATYASKPWISGVSFTKSTKLFITVLEDQGNMSTSSIGWSYSELEKDVNPRLPLTHDVEKYLQHLLNTYPGAVPSISISEEDGYVVTLASLSKCAAYTGPLIKEFPNLPSETLIAKVKENSDTITFRVNRLVRLPDACRRILSRSRLKIALFIKHKFSTGEGSQITEAPVTGDD